MNNEVEKHYTKGNILSLIENGLGKAGKDLLSLTLEDVSAVDEFHIGGRAASEHFFPKLELSEGLKVLDVGAGIGGCARHAAHTYGVNVIGIDLTDEYVEVGNDLSRRLGISEKVQLLVGDATSLDLPDASLDAAFTMHVLMNVEQKAKVFDEVYRVLRPGSVFGIFDILKYGDTLLSFPVPWSTDPSTSFLGTLVEYTEALKDSGFFVENVEDRHEFAIEYFRKVSVKMSEPGGPPPVGIHLLMGETAAVKLGNVVAGLEAGAIAPFEIIARKPV